VGESLEQREAGCVEEVVLGQLESALCSVAQKEIPRVAVAYEPVWAIGTGRTASSEQAEEVHDLIRRFVHRHYGDGAAARIRILYGGSVKPENAADLFARANIDGVLVGGASLQAETFAAIAKTGG
jgi:triosephosphate isomerase